MPDEQPMEPTDLPPVSGGAYAVSPAPGQVMEPQPGPESRTTTLALVGELEKLRKSKVVIYHTSGMAKIGEGIVAPLFDQLEAIGDVEHLDLVLDTLGGSAEMPWRIVSLIREFSERFSVLIPHRAASAGTLLALGADEIVMTRLAALGPIDPSRTHPLLPHLPGEQPEPVSVQDMRHAMQFIREAGRAEGEFAYSPEAMAQIFTALFDKLHPLVIGAIEQSYALAKLVGRRCLETHMTGPDDPAKIERIVDQLCDDYKSHGYQIPRREAKAIGLPVKHATKRVEAVLMQIFRHICGRPLAPPMQPTPGVPFTTHIAWLDSSVMTLRCEAAQRLNAEGGQEPLGDRWLPY